MKLTEIALKETRLTYSLVLFVIAGGVIAFLNLPRFEDPRIPFRYAFITTLYPGASVERVESLITQPIEEVLSEIPEVEFVNSESRNNAAGIIFKIQDRYDDLQPIWDRIRRKLDRLKSDLPEGTRGPFFNDEFGEVFGTMIAITGKGVALSQIRRQTVALRERLLRLDEVSKVLIIGDREERIVVEYDGDDMADLGLSPMHLKSFLEAQNAMAPGGAIQEGERQVSVEARSDLTSAEAIAEIQVRLPDEEDAYALWELLDVRRESVDPPMSIVRSSGLPALLLAISLREGGNIEKLGRDVEAAVADFSARSATPLNVDFVAFEPSRVTQRVNRFFVNLLQSLAIVMLILVLALGLRSGSVVASMMPLVILASLVVMLGLDLNINLVALAAFIVVLGIMVDNHIVISERVLSLREEGVSARQAAIESTSQLYAPLVTATATTISGFLPIYLADSSGGEYVRPLFRVVTIALICSTLFAFTITPLLSIRLFRVDPESPGPTVRKHLQGAYERILRTLLPRPWLVLSVLLVLFVGAFYSLRSIPAVFFPPSDRPIFILELEFPSSSSIATTEAAVAKLENYVAENLSAGSSETPRILNWVAFAGRNAPRFVLNHRTREFSPEYAYFLFNIESKDSIPFFREKLEGFCHAEFPRAQVRVQPIEAGPAIGFPIRVHVSGDQIDGMFEIARQIEEQMVTIPGVYHIGDDWGPPVKKYHVVIDEDAAGLAGVTRGEVALALQTFLTGIPATDLRAGREVIPILIKSTLNRESDLEKIQALPVFSNITQKAAPLGRVASIEEVAQSANIIRRDFRRTVTVRADIEEGINYREVDREIAAFIKENQTAWGDEYYVRLGGEGTQSAKANRSILIHLPWAIFLILLLLIRQTRSIRRSVIVMSAVPMGLLGVVLGLLVTRLPFGFTTLVGIVSLTGIVVNNAIILLDRIRLNEIEAALSPQQCIIEACLNRLRPILLTTLTTIGGILPLYLRGNPTWQGMAVAIIFGLFVATLLVLLVMPVLYAVLFRVPFRDYPASAPNQ